MPLLQTSAPAIEPVTLVDMKNYLRVDSDLTQDDALITMLISAARRYAESVTGRSFISQGWRLVLDSFPGYGMTGVQWGVGYSHPRNAVLLEKGPVISVDSIVYTDMGGATQTIATPGAPDYAVDLTGPVPRITPGFGKIWPIPLPQIGAVQVNYTAGYGTTAASVPEGIRQWLMLRVATMYENREEVAILGRGKVDPLPFVDGLLDPYRVPQL